MPTYDYVCDACGHRVEVIHGVYGHGPTECPNCHAGFEQYCDNGNTETYNSPDNRSGGHTFGGQCAASRGERRIRFDELFIEVAECCFGCGRPDVGWRRVRTWNDAEEADGEQKIRQDGSIH